MFGRFDVSALRCRRASIREKLGASSIPTLVRGVLEVWSPPDERPE
ncbi:MULTISPECIES: hypothetical protein [unclassified Paraburkholderia]|nr:MULTISPECIES: hypothetical protein [unclassified Paraburkholderia]MBB5443065.1 hypothetical protein [Paraburkholderia sp. WSM4177]MBB5483330.1 hypothetical protein [Paraburkholderia sp. WSM4180]